MNLQALRPGEIGGNETYVRQLMHQLPRIDPRVRLVLFCADYNAELFRGGLNVELHVLDAAAFAALDADRLRRHRLDLWFCPLLVLEPHEPGLPAVVTIPDLQHQAYPDFFPAHILAWRREHYPRSARRAQAILTYSEFSRRQIVEAFGIPATAVHAVHLDAAPAFSSRVGRVDRDHLEALQSRYRLPDDFVFYPANTWPHKNHGALFAALDVDFPRLDAGCHVVLTGARVDNGAATAVSLPGSGRVRHLGYLPDGDLPGLYALARALVFPSLFEGFGLPVVEAMRSGCPVICSNAACLPEIAADAAVYFDPRDPRQIAAAIAAMTPDKAREFAAAGRRRALRFDWSETARLTLAVMRNSVEPATASAIEPGRGDPPLISIVTPSLQQGPFIERTLKSVLEQDYPRIEHWVIDGGSTDQTLEILERYRHRYPGTLNYVSEPDSGQAAAVNKGIGRARGEIIGWINSDDTYEPGSFAAIADAFEANSACDLVYGRGYFTAADDQRLWEYPTRPRFDWQGLVHECYICQPTVFWRRTVTDGGARLDEHLQLALDYDLWIRLGRRFKFHFVDRHLANSRIYRETKTIRQRGLVFAESFEVVKRHYGWLPWSWALGRAHYRRDGGDAFFNVHPVAPATYLWAFATLARHNWPAPRYWRRLMGEVRPVVSHGLCSLWRRLAPSIRHPLSLPKECLVAEVGVEVTRQAAGRSTPVDLWWAGHHLARFQVSGPGTYTCRASLPHKEEPGPYKMELRSDLLRLAAARALDSRAFPVAGADGWLEQCDTLRLPAGWTEVEIAFMLPAVANGGAELRFRFQEETIEEWLLDRPGMHRRRLRLPPGWSWDGRETELEFTSSSALPPDPGRGETRRLAVHLREIIDLTPRAGRVRA